MNKMVNEHNEVRHLEELDHYEAHENRKESSEFRKLKAEFHNDNAKCFIDNGYCEGDVEIHHGTIEFSASTEVDWKRVMKDYGFDHVDDKKQMMPLCTKHHRGRYTGIHSITYPIWILQKYLLPEPLEDFEKQVALLLEGKEVDRDGEV